MVPLRFFSRLLAGALACFCAMAWAVPQRDWPQMPSPPSTSTYWIAEYLEQNTIPMQIRGFDSKLSMQEVTRFYEKWFADKQGYGVSQVGPVKVLGARLGVYQVTVQLRGRPEGTVGRLVLAAVYEPHQEMLNEEERTARIGAGFPRPPGSRVISDTLSFDPGVRNRTIVVMNGNSVEVNTLYLREHLLKLGWTLLQDRTMEGGRRSALVFRRKAEEMTVTVVQKDDQYMVIASQTSPE